MSPRPGGSDAARDPPLTGKVVYIPPMAYGSARAFAAGFCALGVDARLTPASNERTAELAAGHMSGDECFPAKVTVGDFLRVLETGDVDPDRAVLFMPTADGPCRFGQYAPYLRGLLDAKGYTGTTVLSPSSQNAYGGLGRLSGSFVRTSWRMLVAADILQKLLLQHRPYEVAAGSADRVFEQCLDDVCGTVEGAPLRPAAQLRALHGALVRCRDRFAALPTVPDDNRPLIGVVGEIFCRLNTYSNQDAVRRLELAGGEVWLAGITEWVWYTLAEQYRKLRLGKRLVSGEGVGTWIRERFQHGDERVLLEPFRQAFQGYEEPPIRDVIRAAHPYLPAGGALGEMVLNVGRAIRLAAAGVDGIIDLSVFTCMNAIVCQAVYPRVSRDLRGLPIRTLYFDGTPLDLEGELDLYLDLARTYRRRTGATRPPAAPLSPFHHRAG
jgi:predicted nucleotide-binding protein (sugar kinase/HSP70/actin superfamily)